MFTLHLTHFSIEIIKEYETVISLLTFTSAMSNFIHSIKIKEKLFRRAYLSSARDAAKIIDWTTTVQTKNRYHVHKHNLALIKSTLFTHEINKTCFKKIINGWKDVPRRVSVQHPTQAFRTQTPNARRQLTLPTTLTCSVARLCACQRGISPCWKNLFLHFIWCKVTVGVLFVVII